jgi:hypothetical protein
MMGYLIGYPGQLIIVTKESASKPLMEFARPVVSVSERHFVLHDESGDVVQTYADNTLGKMLFAVPFERSLADFRPHTRPIARFQGERAILTVAAALPSPPSALSPPSPAE